MSCRLPGEPQDPQLGHLSLSRVAVRHGWSCLIAGLVCGVQPGAASMPLPAATPQPLSEVLKSMTASCHPYLGWAEGWGKACLSGVFKGGFLKLAGHYTLGKIDVPV